MKHSAVKVRFFTVISSNIIYFVGDIQLSGLKSNICNDDPVFKTWPAFNVKRWGEGESPPPSQPFIEQCKSVIFLQGLITHKLSYVSSISFSLTLTHTHTCSLLVLKHTHLYRCVNVLLPYTSSLAHTQTNTNTHTHILVCSSKHPPLHT